MGVVRGPQDREQRAQVDPTIVGASPTSAPSLWQHHHQIVPTLAMALKGIVNRSFTTNGLAYYPGPTPCDHSGMKWKPSYQSIQAAVLHPVLRLISRTIRHPVSVRCGARSSLLSSEKGLAVVGISLQDVLANNSRSVPLSVVG